MPSSQQPVLDITGVILAGGMGRRMQGADKGLVPVKGATMVSRVIDVLKLNVSEIVINANRNVESYKKYGYPVVSDSLEGFQGPLAGFEAGMSASTTAWVYTCPCDSPLQSSELLPYMFKEVVKDDAEIGVAFDGNRTHPVFSLVRTDLLPSLQNYLRAGDRKIDRWFASHKLLTVECSNYKKSFVNVNTEEELTQLEQDYNQQDSNGHR